MKQEFEIAEENIKKLKEWDKRKESHNLCSHRVDYLPKVFHKYIVIGFFTSLFSSIIWTLKGAVISVDRRW